MQLAIHIVGGAAWLAVLAGLLLLAYRSKKLAGGSLVVSMVAIVIWSFWGGVLAEWVNSFVSEAPCAMPDTAGQGNSASTLLAMGHTQTIVNVCESLLMLWFGLSFLLAVISLKSYKVRPNNSFKPTPLRGAA